MRIFYAYELGGIEKHYQQHFIELSDDITCNGLNYEILLDLLKQERANINNNSVLCYFDEEKKAYVTVKRGDVIPNSEHLKILIRRGHSHFINELLQKIESLQHQVQSLEEKLEVKQKELSSKPKKKESTLKPAYFDLDIAMLHAAPLAYIRKSKHFAYDEPSLDFEGEKKILLESLKESADLRFEAATSENLDELLEYMPKIIIISCESYCNPDNEFVLAFEKHDLANDGKGEIGLLYEISSRSLKKMLMAANQYLQVVIVKGRYAQEMGNMILAAGFSCVVAVHDQDRDENFGMKFIADLCNNLLEGATIEQSYKSSEKLFSRDVSYCCCAHSHKPDCLWVKKIKISNTQKLHDVHSSDSCCELQGSMHKQQCSNVAVFNLKYANSLNLLSRSQSSDTVTLCCCSPELDHKSLKFSILCNDQSVLDQILFESHKKSKTEIRSALSAHLKPQNIQKFTVGRRLEIREIILMTLTNRCVNVTGLCGIGKTMVVKRAAQYAYERRIFKDGVVYLDFLMRTDIIFLYRYIANTLNLPSFNNHKDLCAVINELDVLLIIDNIDPLLKHNKFSLIDTYTYILNHTTKPKFLIVSQLILGLKESKQYEMPLLSLPQATKLLRHFSQLNNNLDIPHKVFDCIGTKPADILQISPLFSQTTYEKIIEELTENKSLNEDISSLSISLEYITNKISQSIDFLKLLSYLPSGVFLLNIKQLCKEVIPNYMDILEMLKYEGKSTGT